MIYVQPSEPDTADRAAGTNPDQADPTGGDDDSGVVNAAPMSGVITNEGTEGPSKRGRSSE